MSISARARHFQQDIVTVLGLTCLSLVYFLTQFDRTVHPFEDAAMLMRYAEHLSQGLGIVWNVGAPPVDGGTDFLFILLVALVTHLGLSIESAVRSILLISHILTVWLVYFGVRYLTGRNWPMAVASSLFVAMGPGLAYTTAYFGTPFFGFLATATWLFATYLMITPETKSVAWWFATSSLLLGLTRPEGVFLAVFMLIAILVVRGWSASKHTVGAFCAVVGILGGMYFGWRWNYFGYPLPNPFYKKASPSGRSLYTAIEGMVSLSFPFIFLFLYGPALLLWKYLLGLNTLRRTSVVRFVGIASALVAVLLLIRRSSGDSSVLIAGRYSAAVIVLVITLLSCSVAIVSSARHLASALSGDRDMDEMSPLSDERLWRRLFIGTLVPLIGFTLIWGVISDDMNFLNRFQYAGALVVLISWPVALVDHRRGPSTGPAIGGRRLPDTRLPPAVCILLLLVCVFQWRQFREATANSRKALFEVGSLLGKYRDKGYRLATTEAGLIPFYSKWNALDTWGLNDQWIAHHGSVTPAYLERFNPELVIWNGPFSPLVPPEDAKSDAWVSMVLTLKEYAESRHYRLAAAFGPTPFHCIYFYVKTDFPDSDEIVRAIATMKFYGDASKRPYFNFATVQPVRSY